MGKGKKKKNGIDGKPKGSQMEIKGKIKAEEIFSYRYPNCLLDTK